MNETKIYLELSDEVQQLLADNQITIEDILRTENIDAEVTYGVLPYQLEEGARTKKLVPIIIGVGIVVLPVSLAVSQVLSTINNKPHIVEIYDPQQLKDSKGNILLDKDGRPLYKLVKKYELIEPRTKKNQELEIQVSLENGVVLKFKSEEKSSR
jgi:hypothetical protein